MARVPVPIPEITPNDLLNSRRHSSGSSFGSIRSGVSLLNNEGPTKTPGSSSEGGEKDLARPASRAVLLPDGSPMPFPPPSRAVSRLVQGGNYGAMGLPSTPRLSRASSNTPQSLTRSPAHMRQTSFSQRVQAYGENRLSPPQSLHLPNPFWDPIPRGGTPDSVYTGVTYTVAVVGEKSAGYLSPSQGTPALTTSMLSPPSGRLPRSPAPDVPDSPSSIYSLYSTETENPHENEESKSGPEMVTIHLAPSYLSPQDPRVKSTISSPPRSNTPSSFHSFAPSVHFTGPVDRPTLPAHPRATYEPLARAYTASPRLMHDPESYLPNPFSPVSRAATLRRYASINNAMISGPTSAPLSPPRNALHLHGATGPKSSGIIYGNSYKAGIGAGVPGTQWRQPVMYSGEAR